MGRRGEGFRGDLRALLDRKASPERRRRGLRRYAAFLLVLQGAALLLLAPFLPAAGHPLLLLLAFLGAGWLLLQGRLALQEGGSQGPLVAVGLGAALFFFLGVVGVLLRPWGLFLPLLGVVGFGVLLRWAEKSLTRGSGGSGSDP